MMQRFLSVVFLALSSVGLLFVTAGDTQAWGWWGYWGGWGYPYAGYSYRYRSWGYWGYPYASYYYPSYYYSPYATYSFSPGTYTYSPSVSQSLYYTPSAADDRAHVTVEVPAPTAQLWLQGQQMMQTGMVRTFDSPPLAPGHNYTYTVRARWLQNGTMNDQTQTVRIRPGQDVNVRFGS
jgi:uncharacterized protein (TIGR03000 family)